MSVMAFVKDNPVPVGIGVVVLLAIIVSSRGGNSGGGDNGAGYALQAQSIAANSNEKIAALNLQHAISSGEQAVENNRIAANAATARTGVMAELYASVTGVNAQVAMNNSGNLLKSTQALYDREENLKALDNELAVSSKAIAADVEMNAAKLATQHAMLVEDNNFKLSAIGAETQGNLSMLREQGSLNLAFEKERAKNEGVAVDRANNFMLAMSDRNIQTLPLLLQHERNRQQMTGDTAYRLMMLQTEADRKRAQSESNEKNAGVIGGVIKLIASLFG